MTEQERIKRFESAYNRIDKALAEISERDKRGNRRSYAAKVRIAAHQVRRLAKHVDFLLEVGELRNAIIHNRLGDGSYIAVPLEATVVHLEEIERTIFAPDHVVPQFQCTVRILSPEDSLSTVGELMRDTGFTRFPVYTNGSFTGLLTSDGLARWCAIQMKDGRLNIDAKNVHVEDILAVDRHRERTAIVARDTPIDDVEFLFRDNPRLMAVIITEHGRGTERPIGMVTPGGVLRAAGA